MSSEPLNKSKVETGKDGKKYYAEGQHAGMEIGSIRKPKNIKTETPKKSKPKTKEDDAKPKSDVDPDEHKSSKQNLDSALSYARAGNWDAAWDTAKHDPAVKEGVTKQKWIEWALDHLANGGEKLDSPKDVQNGDELSPGSVPKFDFLSNFNDDQLTRTIIDVERIIQFLEENDVPKDDEFFKTVKEYLDMAEKQKGSSEEKEDLKKSETEIEQDIDRLANAMEKSTQGTKEKLFDTIKQLGPEGLRSKIPTLQKSQKIVLLEVLEEMKKGESAVTMDDAYAAKYHRGDVYNDSVIQEDHVDDDADEKLVKEEAAKHKHQGDESPEGKKGQIIKGERPSEESLEKAQGVPAGVDPEKKERCVKEVKAQGHDEESAHAICNASLKKSSEELIEFLNKSSDALYKMMYKMCKMGKNRAEIMKACKAQGFDMSSVESTYDKAYKAYSKGMQKSDDVKLLPEEDQLSDTDEATEGKTRSSGKRPEALKVDKENKDAQDKVDDLDQCGLKKSVTWEDQNKLLKAGVLGRNHHFSINDFYDQLLAKGADESPAEPLAKSEGQPTENLNDLIEKGLDCTADEVLCKSLIAANLESVNGHTYASFGESDIAKIMGLTEEQAKEILG